MRNPAADEGGGAGPEGHEAFLGSLDFILGCTPLCILEGFLPPHPSWAQRERRGWSGAHSAAGMGQRGQIQLV